MLIWAENLYKRINGVISFVAENPVRAIASPTQTWLSKWYREVSQPFPRPLANIEADRMLCTELAGLRFEDPRSLGAEAV